LTFDNLKSQKLFENSFQPRSGDQKVARRETSGTRRRLIPASQMRADVLALLQSADIFLDRDQTLHVWLPSLCAFGAKI
jgi:hypothetical protein